MPAEPRSPLLRLRRVDTSASLRSRLVTPPGTPPPARRPLRHTENLQTMRAQLTTPPLPGARPQRHTENLQTMQARLAADGAPRPQTIRLISASSADAQGVDSEGNVVLPIDDLEMQTLKEGERVTLSSAPSFASLSTATARLTMVTETETEQPEVVQTEETSSIDTEDSVSVTSRPWGPASSQSGHTMDPSDASLLEEQGPHMPPATSEQYKSHRFRDNLAVVGSMMYATFLVMIGLVVFVADIAQPGIEIAEIYTFCLSSIGLLWLIFLHTHVQMYLKRLAKAAKGSAEGIGALERQLILEPTDVEGEYLVKMPFKQTAAEMIKCQYSFSVGRHSGSFYLKIGAAFFCFGHMVHLVLLLIRQVYKVMDHGDECLDVPALMLYFVQPVFSFFQLYVTFKYSNIVINNHQTSARFGFMHCIASSFNMWIWSIVKETLDAVSEHNVETHHHLNVTNCSDCTVSLALEETSLVYQKCVFNDTISETVTSLSGYLYPLTIEFNILIVGVWFVIWQNIGNTKIGQFLIGDVTQVEGARNQAILQVDCARANRGLLGGLLVFVFIVVDIILFFSLSDHDSHEGSMALYLNQSTEIFLMAMMTLLCLVAYHKLSGLDINIHPISFLDDLLLFICLPAFFLYGLIILVPAVFMQSDSSLASPLDIILPLLLVLEVIIQTPFLMDSLRRCSNTEELRAAKPGREYVTVLLFSNLAMWLLQTLEGQAGESTLGAEFYGNFIWTLLRHATLPLCLFYRFHSSVCLADIWKAAYEPGS